MIYPYVESEHAGAFNTKVTLARHLVSGGEPEDPELRTRYIEIKRAWDGIPDALRRVLGDYFRECYRDWEHGGHKSGGPEEYATTKETLCFAATAIVALTEAARPLLADRAFATLRKAEDTARRAEDDLRTFKRH